MMGKKKNKYRGDPAGYWPLAPAKAGAQQGFAMLTLLSGFLLARE
jgi:hypothetical protein